MIDNHGRTIDYVRLAVTDKCNLRCFYCMPEEGIKFKPKKELLSYEEMLRLMTILAKQGISKVRITGGEPFLRKDIMFLLECLRNIEGIEKIAITTNGTLTATYLDQLEKLGITSFNLSLDSIDSKRFYAITRRDSFDTVWHCYQTMIDRNCTVKINCVVMDGQNIDDIIPMVELGRKDPVAVRFIEEMPFNGKGKTATELNWNYKKIINHIQDHFGNVVRLKDPANSTSMNFQVPGFTGTFGVIPAYSRTFCGTCNRIRITPEGMLKTCLYDQGVFNFRDLLRAGANDEELLTAILQAIGHRAKDGFEAEENRDPFNHISESMATIGG